MRSFNGDFPPWRCSGRHRRRGKRRRHPLGYPMQMIDLLDLNLAVAAVVVIAVGVLAAGGDFASRNGGW